MRTCTCTLQFTTPDACSRCSFVCSDGDHWLLPIDPRTTEVIFDEGIGDLFAEGALAVAKEFGLEDVVVHAKGMTPPGYEPRKMKGMGLGFATTARGACHLRATMYKPELTGVTTYGEVTDKAPVYVDWEDRLTIMDTLIYCRFYRDMVQWPYITAVVNAVIGTDYTEDDLHRIAAPAGKPAPALAAA